jgi:hypothetical protein
MRLCWIVLAIPAPNRSLSEQAYLVKTIRAKHPDAPVIMIQSVIREIGNFDSTINRLVQRQNENVLKEYQKLLREGVKKLYLILGEICWEATTKEQQTAPIPMTWVLTGCCR